MPLAIQETESNASLFPRTILRVKRSREDDAIDCLQVVLPRKKRRRTALNLSPEELSVENEGTQGVDDRTQILNFERVHSVEPETNSQRADGSKKRTVTTKDSAIAVGEKSLRERIFDYHSREDPQKDLDAKTTSVLGSEARVIDVDPTRNNSVPGADANNVPSQDRRSSNGECSPVRSVEDEYMKGQSCVYDFYEVAVSKSTLPKTALQSLDPFSKSTAIIEWADDMPDLFFGDDEEDEESSAPSSDIEAHSVDYPSTPEEENSDEGDFDIVGGCLNSVENSEDLEAYDPEEDAEELSLDYRAIWRERLNNIR